MTPADPPKTGILTPFKQVPVVLLTDILSCIYLRIVMCSTFILPRADVAKGNAQLHLTLFGQCPS